MQQMNSIDTSLAETPVKGVRVLHRELSQPCEQHAMGTASRAGKIQGDRKGRPYYETVTPMRVIVGATLAVALDACLRLGAFLLNQWANIITILLGLLVLVTIAIPFLSYWGLDSIAKPLFYSLHYMCAQIPSHSFYILGHQLGLCARNLGVYGSMFLGSLVFILTKKRLPGIPWWVWVLLIMPMALDGTTQMFGWRESTWVLRVVTGTLFGLGSVWFVLPMMHKTIVEETPPVLPHVPRRPMISILSR